MALEDESFAVRGEAARAALYGWSRVQENPELLKAILPVLWQLFPNHPLLLKSSFELNEDLKSSGYVEKPIVGRCGSNIKIFDRDENLLESTEGAFESRDQIYQELFELPHIDGQYVQVCTFSAAGVYAGSCVRVDTAMVINEHSDVIALRVVDDEDILDP